MAGRAAPRAVGAAIAARVAPADTRLAWIALYGLLLLSWAALWAMDPLAALPPGAQALGADMLRALCLAAARDADFWRLWAMWAVMGAAMMLPTVLPALRDYAHVCAAAAARGAEAAPGVALLGLAGGYLAVWAGFAAAAAAAQTALSAQGWLDVFGRSTHAPLTAALLALAGLWQFSPLKDACLSRCRAPLSLFIARWRPGAGPALRIGARMGADCVACCWALMALAFVGGATSLLWMGAATVFMALEKLPDLGRPLTRPMGWALLLGAGGVLAA